MTIGTCDVCEAQNVELTRRDACGIETWACENCTADPSWLRQEIERDTRNAIAVSRMFNLFTPKG